MKRADCVIVRVGELALKSRQVQKPYFRALLRNIRAKLNSENISYKIKTDLNIFQLSNINHHCKYHESPRCSTIFLVSAKDRS